jgi:serine/threonine-protein kinase
VVHRDLKPQNLFLAWEQSGETVPKLLDFGMAKLLGESSVHTVSGVPIGTPLYMSPEQARGEKVDGRSDVYALGVLCHEMLTGRVPFTGESPLAVLVSHLTIPPPRASEVLPELPLELDEPILAMLHKEPSGRPATAGDAIAALVAAADRAGRPVPAGMPHLPRPQGMPSAAATTFSPHPMTPEPVADATPSGQRARGTRTDTQPSPERRRASWPLGALLIALAVLVAYLGRSALDGPGSSRAASSTAAPASSLAATSAAPVPAPTPAAAAASSVAQAPVADAPAATSPALNAPVEKRPEHVQLLLHGAPAGARVQRGDELLGDASSALRLPFGKTPLELTVTAPGYEAMTLSFVPDQDGERDVKLRKRAPRPKQKREIPSDLESPF